MNEEIYVITVNLPGCLPEAEPYAVLGERMAWDCARNELDEQDHWPYAHDKWHLLLKAGYSVFIGLESGYVLGVVPLSSLSLSQPDRDRYRAQAEGGLDA